MYTEERPRRGNLLKEFIMKLILIIIFVLLLIWLVPWPNMDSYMKAINPLKDQIFNTNLQTMKEAGITYFTSERLPKEVGDKTTISLQQMLDMKLLVPFTDRNGNSCDVTKSYVSLEKKDTEYLMKVNLKCGEEEDYILVHLGCYSYCTTDICEAKPNKTEKPSTIPKEKTDDNVKPSITPTVKPTVSPTSDPTVTPTYKPTVYKCSIINGVYYDNKGNVTNEANYNNLCNGKVPDTPDQPTIICSIVNGIYYDNKGNVTNQSNYNNLCNTVIVNPPVKTYNCKFVNGQYWGKYSTVVSQSEYQDQCVAKPSPSPVAKKEYEYKKETSTYYAKQYSNWSNWQEYVTKKSDNIQYGRWDTKEVEDLGTKYVKVGTKDAVIDNVIVLKPYQKQITTAKYTVCKEKEYVIETKTTVTYTTTHTETVTTPGYTIVEGEQQLVQVNGNWSYQNNWYRGYNPPVDTASSRWIFQGVDFAYCGSSCTNHPYVVYREQTRPTKTYTIGGGSTTTQTGGSSSGSSATSSNTSVSERIISEGCSQLEEREVPVYGTFVKSEIKSVVKEPAQDIMAWVRYHRVRTRTLLKDEYTDYKVDYKWSSYNNSSLLNAGYVYTGKTRTVGK